MQYYSRFQNYHFWGITNEPLYHLLEMKLFACNSKEVHDQNNGFCFALSEQCPLVIISGVSSAVHI